MMFANRVDAGRRLAKELERFRDRRPVVLALPRGGVPVGWEIAKALEAPLDVVIVRKIGHPLSPEYAIGAIADGTGIEKVLDDEALLAGMDVEPAYVAAEIERQTREIERRRALFYRDCSPTDLAGRTVLMVDDGIATGATMRAAVKAARSRNPAHVVLAVPVAPPSAIDLLRRDVDEVVCLMVREDFGAVGRFYRDFTQVEDAEVIALLETGRRAQAEREAKSPSK